LQYTHDLVQAKEYSKEALNRLLHEKVPPTPENYELWYVYYSGQSQEVIKAIDVLIANKQKITDERCKELYQRFLSESRNEDTIRRAGDQIHTAISNVAGTVKQVKNATSTYQGKLGGVSARIEKIKDEKEFRQIISTMITDTQAMLDQNQALEQELDKSSSLMEELQRDLEKVRREALTDGLTGLANRKAFDSEIKRVIDAATASGKPFTLLLLDIDYFKNFNDNYGHQVGDQVLRLVARTLTDGVKGRDMAARYGGEEFVIILPDTALESAIVVANNLRNAVATKDVINRNSGEKLGRITMSSGVAEYVAGEDARDLIERADAALYTAKHNGRNQVAAAPTPSASKTKKEAF